MKKHHNMPLQIIANLCSSVSKSLRSLWSWSVKSATRKSGLTSSYKKSIIQTEFEDSKLFVWLRKRFRSIRKATVDSSLKESRFFQQLPKGRKSKVTKMVKHFSSFRVLVVASVITSALFLVACGGGGGGSATVATPVIPVPVVPVVNAPVLTLASMSPLPVASPLLVTSDKVLEGVTQVLVMTPQSTTLAGNAALAADKKSVTITMSSSFPYATVITVTVKAKANGVEGSVTGTVTTESAPVASWPPVFVPMGTKVYLDAKTAPAGAVTNATFPGQTQSGLLPPECRTHTDASWWKAVKNGTVKFRPTTARNLLQPTRPIVFGSYRTIDTIFFPGQNVVAYCSKPFFADDGTLVNPNEPVEGGACNLTREQVYHIGNEQGEVLQQKNPSTGVSTCYQKKFVLNPDGISGGWTETNVPCL